MKRLYYDRAKWEEPWERLKAAYRAGHLTNRELFAQGRIYHHAALVTHSRSVWDGAE